MAGLMTGLDAESYDRKYSDKELYRRILQRFGPQRSQLIRVCTLVVLQSMAGTAVPLLIARSIDLLQSDQSFDRMIGVVLVAILLGSLDWLFNYLNQSLSSRAIGDMVRALREDTLSATLRRDMRFFDQQLPGRIISRITSDTQEMGALVTLLADMLASLLIVFLAFSVMFYKSPQLAIISVATAPFVWLATLFFRRIARRMSTGSRRILGVLNGQIQESISGISVAKGFRQERAMFDAFEVNNRQGYSINLRQGWTFNTIFPILQMLSGLGTALVIYFGGSAVFESARTGITAGDWYFFVQSLGLIFFPLTSLASFYSQLQNGLASSERVFALLDRESEIRQESPGQDPGRIRGDITLTDVHFHYQEHEPVFQGLTIDIPAGQSVALVGHTGAGKSSIVNLLSRYYEFQSGSIQIDGQDIRTLDLDRYRRQLGIILQEQLLFDATVADNIRYGRPESTDAEVRAALDRIGASSLIDDLPEGLATRVRERGSRLSVGQRQLVSLARTVLQDPAILVLDEATASVDPLTEVQLQKALEAVMKGRTTLIVAHRLTTIRHVDRIIALDHGRIVEEGTHDVLLARGGYYSTLYDTYYRHQSLQYIEQMGMAVG